MKTKPGGMWGRYPRVGDGEAVRINEPVRDLAPVVLEPEPAAVEPEAAPALAPVEDVPIAEEPKPKAAAKKKPAKKKA